MCVFKILVLLFVCECAYMWARVSHLAYVEVKDKLRDHSLSEAVFVLFTAVFFRLPGLLAPGDFFISALLPTTSSQEHGILNTCYHSQLPVGSLILSSGLHACRIITFLLNQLPSS